MCVCGYSMELDIGLLMRVPCIPLVRASVIFVCGLEIDLSLHKADEHGLLIDLPLQLKTTSSFQRRCSHSTTKEMEVYLKIVAR